jgi:hypothetical protein
VEIISPRSWRSVCGRSQTWSTRRANRVADRWHVLANLSEALNPFFDRTQAQLKALVQKPSETFSMEEEKQLPAWSKGQTDRKVKM